MAYQRTGKVLKLKARRAARVLASYLVVSRCVAVFAEAHGAVDPCCLITTIDATSGVVTAREKAIGRRFQFKVTDAQLLSSLKPGQGVYANYARRLVSLDGSTACCRIVTLESLQQATQGGSSAPTGAGKAVRAVAASGSVGATANNSSSTAATTAQSSKPADEKKTDDSTEKVKSEIKKQFKKRLKFP